MMQGERRLPVPGVRAAIVRREVLLGQEAPRGRVRDAQARQLYIKASFSAKNLSRKLAFKVLQLVHCSQGAADRVQDEGPLQQTGVSSYVESVWF